MQYLYLLLNLGSLSIPFLFSFHPKLKFYKYWKPLTIGIITSMLIFIPWDIIFTAKGIWGFNDDYFLGTKLFHLPIEEWLFFICIPYACVFTHFALLHYFPNMKLSKSVTKKISYLLIIAFFAAFEQAGGFLSIYAKEQTNRMFMGWAVPAPWFQSLNSFFIITLGVAIAAFWAKRKLKGTEASSLFKMIIGLGLVGLGFLFMSAAASEYDNTGTSAMYWLVLAYLLHTIGELCLSPVSLSFVTKLAPAKYASIMMGIYFATTGLGNKAAGLLGESSSLFGEYKVFTGIAIFCVVFALLVFMFFKKLKSLTHGAEDNEVDYSTKEAEGFELADEN